MCGAVPGPACQCACVSIRNPGLRQCVPCLHRRVGAPATSSPARRSNGSGRRSRWCYHGPLLWQSADWRSIIPGDEWGIDLCVRASLSCKHVPDFGFPSGEEAEGGGRPISNFCLGGARQSQRLMRTARDIPSLSEGDHIWHTHKQTPLCRKGCPSMPLPRRRLAMSTPISIPASTRPQHVNIAHRRRCRGVAL